MPRRTNHISVCLCTFKRPEFLKRLLNELLRQKTEGRFTYSIVVADNDCLRSAEMCVAQIATTTATPICYCVEPRQNIALARNKAMEHADGEFLAFIDDDEFPARDWLLNLFGACTERVDGVVGSVKRHFEGRPPKWIVKGGFYERATFPTGHQIDWRQGRTNNVMIRTRIVPPEPQPFRPEFRSGEDQDFFRRMIEQGCFFIWCNEAVVYETVPPVRWKRAFLLRRALLQGSASALHPTFGPAEAAKSLVALPLYLLALPFTLLSPSRFMLLLVRICDHAGKLLAIVRINPIKEPYITS